MDIPLGKPTSFPEHYDPTQLAPIERAPARLTMGISGSLPFVGEDIWNAYEFSWLSPSGLPRVAALRLRVDAASPKMVESKSMKLYLNSFAEAHFESREAVAKVLEGDLSDAFGARVSLDLLELDELGRLCGDLLGSCLDDQEVSVDIYERKADLLTTAEHDQVVEEELYTHLFRTLCPVTGQPDWASVLVRYQGPAIDHGGLLRYLVSFRRHQGFHETTIEQIFLDLKDRCGCERLLVGGYFLRRGGVDINPFRSDPGEAWHPVRLVRQ